MGPADLLGLNSDELSARAETRLVRGAGVAGQIYSDAHRRGVFEPEAHGLSKEASEAWRREFTLGLLEVVRVVEEPGEEETTRKAVLRTHDGLEIESVCIPMGPEKLTLCVSSQVGCKMACKFCETGRMGLLRDLSAAEIVAQVVVARTVLGWPVGNVVFMGMGEALDNTDALIPALRILNDKRGLQISQQRMTICTVGHAEGLQRLRELGWKRLNLSVSLNAARDDARTALMPINKKTPLAALSKALRAYPMRDSFIFGVNYCLMPGINDTREDARGVAEFARGLGRVMVNIIPYNPGTAPLTRAPEDEEIARFIGWLSDEGLPVRRRVTKGRSVMAACGQLGNVALRRRAIRD